MDTNALTDALLGELAVPSPSIDQVMQVQAAMQAMPQLELQATMHFTDHACARELFMPAGAALVGRMHKTKHLLVVCSGTVRMTAEGLMQDITGPCVLHTTPGTKRLILALTDATLITFHVTEETDVDRIAEQILMPDPVPALENGQ